MFAQNAGVGQRSLVTRLLPLILAAAGFLLYLLTLNGWISLGNLGLMARISGWFRHPEFGQTLVIALFFPFRCLPETWVPVVLNLFTAGCAAGVLALLARSVSLLPYYQNPPDKKKELPKLQLHWPNLKHVELVEDASVSPGGCRVMTRHGEVNAQIDTQLDRVIAELMPENSPTA